jgi:hypothetical protein
VCLGARLKADLASVFVTREAIVLDAKRALCLDGRGQAYAREIAAKAIAWIS